MPLIEVTYRRAVPDRIETLVVRTESGDEIDRGIWVQEGDAVRWIPPGQIIEVTAPVAMVASAAQVAGKGGELEMLLGVGDEVAQAMRNAGIRSLDDVRSATDDDLLAIPGIGKATLAKIREQVG